MRIATRWMLLIGLVAIDIACSCPVVDLNPPRSWWRCATTAHSLQEIEHFQRDTRVFVHVKEYQGAEPRWRLNPGFAIDVFAIGECGPVAREEPLERFADGCRWSSFLLLRFHMGNSYEFIARGVTAHVVVEEGRPSFSLSGELEPRMSNPPRYRTNRPLQPRMVGFRFRVSEVGPLKETPWVERWCKSRALTSSLAAFLGCDTAGAMQSGEVRRE